MRKQKLALASIIMSVLVTGGMLFSITANAETPKEDISKSITKQSVQKTHVQKRSAGMVKITCKSGANIRSGPGLNYKKIGVANWGDEIESGDFEEDSRGIVWYHIFNYKGISSGWVSSEVASEG